MASRERNPLESPASPDLVKHLLRLAKLSLRAVAASAASEAMLPPKPLSQSLLTLVPVVSPETQPNAKSELL